MPIYVYTCRHCERDTEIFEKTNPYRHGRKPPATVPCELCGRPAARNFVTDFQRTPEWKPRFFENLAPNPIWCETKADHDRELKARGLRIKDRGEK